MDYLKAFIIGGIICAIVQLLIDKTTLLPGRIMVGLVVLGSILCAIGLYEPMLKFAGAGASVPLLGFGNVLFKGTKKAIESDGFLGLFRGGLTSSSVGISAALIFSYIASLIFNPKADL